MSEKLLKPRRRWLQFSLRTLMFVMVFAAGYFAGISTMLQQTLELRSQATQARENALASEAAARAQAQMAQSKAAELMRQVHSAEYAVKNQPAAESNLAGSEQQSPSEIVAAQKDSDR